MSRATTLNSLGGVLYSALGEKRKGAVVFRRGTARHRQLAIAIWSDDAEQHQWRILELEKQQALACASRMHCFLKDGLEWAISPGGRDAQQHRLLYDALGVEGALVLLLERRCRCFSAGGRPVGEGDDADNIGLVYSTLGERQRTGVLRGGAAVEVVRWATGLGRRQR